MKLAFYAGIIGGTKTGVGVHLSQLLRHIVAQRPTAEYVSFLPSLRAGAQHRRGIRELGEQVVARTVPIPARVLHPVQSYLHLPPMRALLGRPYDVYHMMGVVTDPAVPAGKLVVSLYDTVSLQWPGHEAPLPPWTGRLLRRAAAVLTLSEYSRQSIVRAFGVPPEHVQVIYPGCDHAVYHPHCSAEETARTLAALGIRRPYILYIGGQTPRKNLPRLIRAFARAQQAAGLPHTLVLAGPCSPPGPTVAQALYAVAGSRYQALGYVPDAAVPHLYRGADLLLFPSLGEGFGMPVVEALACGTPVVTAATTALPEAAGPAAVRVDPESEEAIAAGILAVLGEHGPYRVARRALGLAHAATFSWEQCAAQHLAVYDAVRARGRIG